MKKIIYAILIVPFLFASCEREPVAGFYTSTTHADVGETVYFTNTSVDAYDHEWNFGDGSFTNHFNTSHVYTDPGTYTASLTVWGPNGRMDVVHQTITVVIPPPPPTVLEVQVLEYYDEYAVPDASVLLYTSLDDWYDEYNPYIEGFTGSNGIVRFVDIPAIEYFVDVWQFEHHNYILAEEDIGFIHTLPLVPNEVNYFIAWVDFVPDAKKKKGGKYKVMKLEKRKYEDKKLKIPKK